MALGRLGGDHIITSTWRGDYSFAALHLRGDTYLEGAYQMQSLELDGGGVYTLQSFETQQVGQFTVNTDCRMIAFVRSSEGGNAADMEATAGAQSASFLMLQDINVRGARYTVQEAIDLGGNAGWDLQLKGMETFYWVNGSGNWSDINHWSLSSGGPPAGCLPTAADDVVFDQASFTGANQQVTIDPSSAFCHTMDWRMISQPASLENVPNTASSLHVLGSLYFSPLMINRFDGDVHFDSPHDGNEIATANLEFMKNVYFGSARGEWTLLQELDVNDTLFF